jgi:hypothetical protein
MAKETLINQLKEDFQFVKKNPAILGVILYGSHLTDDDTIRSDIDVCIVAPDYKLYEIYRFVMRNLKKHIDDYDIRFFEELPIHIMGEIIENGKVIITADEPALYEYFFPFRKEWEDQKFRLKQII